MHDPDAVDATLKWVGVGLQVLGVILLLVGVAVVRSWLERATAKQPQKRRAVSTDGGRCAQSR